MTTPGRWLVDQIKAKHPVDARSDVFPSATMTLQGLWQTASQDNADHGWH